MMDRVGDELEGRLKKLYSKRDILFNDYFTTDFLIEELYLAFGYNLKMEMTDPSIWKIRAIPSAKLRGSVRHIYYIEVSRSRLTEGLGLLLEEIMTIEAIIEMAEEEDD